VDRARVEDLLDRAVKEQVESLRDWRATLTELVDRVAALEAPVAALHAAPTAEAVHADLREVVSNELATVALILRREIDDVGRKVRHDLGMLLGERVTERRVIDLDAPR
jgi:hypothetical protein